MQMQSDNSLTSQQMRRYRTEITSSRHGFSNFSINVGCGWAAFWALGFVPQPNLPWLQRFHHIRKLQAKPNGGSWM